MRQWNGKFHVSSSHLCICVCGQLCMHMCNFPLVLRMKFRLLSSSVSFSILFSHWSSCQQHLPDYSQLSQLSAIFFFFFPALTSASNSLSLRTQGKTLFFSRAFPNISLCSLPACHIDVLVTTVTNNTVLVTLSCNWFVHQIIKEIISSLRIETILHL